MNKSKVLLILVIVLTVWGAITYPKIGHLTYAAAEKIEASLYGLVKRSVDLDGFQMSFYESEKAENKPVLVLLHGFSSDKFIWARFSRFMTDNYHVIIPDLAGHGESELDPQSNYSGISQVRWLEKLMNKLHIEKAHVAGNSMGGFVAAHFARLLPDRTLSIVLVDPAGVTSPIPSEMDKLLVQGRNPFIINNRNEFDQFYRMTMAKPPIVPGFVLAAVAEKYQNKKQHLSQMFSNFYQRDLLDNELDSINVPVLLIWGTEDQLIHVSSAKVWENGVDNIEVIIMQDIGHMAMTETPEKTAEEVKLFLQKL